MRCDDMTQNLEIDFSSLTEKESVATAHDRDWYC